MSVTALARCVDNHPHAANNTTCQLRPKTRHNEESSQSELDLKKTYKMSVKSTKRFDYSGRKQLNVVREVGVGVHHDAGDAAGGRGCGGSQQCKDDV